MKIKFGCIVFVLLVMSEYIIAMDNEFYGDDSTSMGSGGYSDQPLSRNDYQGRYDDDYNRNKKSFGNNTEISRRKFESKYGNSLNDVENQIASPQKFRAEQEAILKYKGRIKTLKDKMTNGNPTVAEMKLLIQFAEKLGKVYIARAMRLMKDKVKLDTYIDTAKEAVKESTNLITTSGKMLKQAEKDRKTRASTFKKTDNKTRKTDFERKERDAIAKIERTRTSDSIFKSFDNALGTAAQTAAKTSGSGF